jgi:hypothetical protein
VASGEQLPPPPPGRAAPLWQAPGPVAARLSGGQQALQLLTAAGIAGLSAVYGLAAAGSLITYAEGASSPYVVLSLVFQAGICAVIASLAWQVFVQPTLAALRSAAAWSFMALLVFGADVVATDGDPVAVAIAVVPAVALALAIACRRTLPLPDTVRA